MGRHGEPGNHHGVYRAKWVRLTFLAAAGLQVATIFLDFRLMPYCGTIAMAALLAMALSSLGQAPARRRTRHPAVAGLTLLTVAALLADYRTGGYGWSTEVAGGDSFSTLFGRPGSGPQAVEAVLLLAGAAALAAAVLGGAERLLRWWHIPGMLIGLVVLAAAADRAIHPRLLFSLETRIDLRLRLLVFIPAALVIAVLLLATNAALASRGALRLAGAGLLAVVALASIGFRCLAEIEPLQPHSDPFVAEIQLKTTLPAIDMQALLAAAALSRSRAVTTFSGAPPIISSQEAEAKVNQNNFPLATSVAAWSRALAPDASRESGVEAVPYPPSWTGDGTDWARSRPALKATLIAAGLLALVMSLFPIPADPGPGRIPADPGPHRSRVTRLRRFGSALRRYAASRRSGAA